MRSTSTHNLILNALFVALVLLLGMTPIGMIPLGAINVTILHIPVIVGTLFLGLKSGLLLGFFFGLCSLLSAYGLTLTPPSGLAAALGAQSPVLLILMCLIPRLFVPVITWLVNDALNKINKHFSSAVAAAFGSVTNTVFYLSLMVVFYNIAGLNVNELLETLGIHGLSFFGVIGVIAGGAGGLEALAAFLIAPPIVAALGKVKKQTYWSN
ncbi:MAG: ECF transporter S component [Clostridia bacterium]|nr:ECF transporter S component [Clostridia bacterium]